MRNLVSLADIESSEVSALSARAACFGAGEAVPPRLEGMAVGLLFVTTSTRTRTSFWRAATKLGADVACFGPGDLQLNTGETIADTARVMAGYLDMLVVRTNADMDQMRALAQTDDLAVVNALTEDEHPTQAIADLAMLTEEFGDLSGRHILYLGEGNATAVSLAHATMHTPGLQLTVVTPSGYGMPDFVWDDVAAARDRIREQHTIHDLDLQADAVYTSRWQQMGVSKPDADWMTMFEPYRVSEKLTQRCGHDETIFMHDLPAVRGQEVDAEVLDGPMSRAFRQAFHKYTAAAAVLEWCADGDAA